MLGEVGELIREIEVTIVYQRAQVDVVPQWVVTVEKRASLLEESRNASKQQRHGGHDRGAHVPHARRTVHSR